MTLTKEQKIMQMEKKFEAIAAKMRQENLPDIAIKTFKNYYSQLIEGGSGLIPESEIEPVDNLPHLDELEDSYIEKGNDALKHCVMINLNGGLGTSMGLERAKSLLKVKNGLSFLEILAEQAIAEDVPLVLMNSFATQKDSLSVLAKYQALTKEIPQDFLQHKVPKIDAETLDAAEWPADKKMEWCPPGHGDIYTALVTSGMLEQLLKHGYRYAFISNADNLGASLDEKILGFFASNNYPFMSEMARRTEADKKGGHLARRKSDGQLMLREVAQTAEEDLDAFRDINRHRYFNTNSLWLNLEALKELMQKNENIMKLPMIRNKKTVNPRDPQSPEVFQLETAMAAAIAVFDNSQAIEVPRNRFAPVKTTEDLIVVRSDATVMNEKHNVVPNPERKLDTIVVHLDKQFYKLVDDFESRFANGVPSLVHCSKLTIEGDVRFGKNVVCTGEVHLKTSGETQVVISDGSELSGEISL
jgi:UTP--glucose-1-phosphate uridylyltransferase